MLLDPFLNFIQFEKYYSPNTLTSYKKDLQNYFSFLESQEFTVYDATHHQVRAYLASLMANNLMQARSVNKNISTLRSFYKFLLREKVITANPMLLVKNLKIPKQLPSIINEENLIELLDAKDTFAQDFAGQRDRLVMELLFGTGIRRSELLTINEHDIDFNKQTIRILGKRNKERIIPIYSSLSHLIKEYIKNKEHTFDKKTERLIVTNKGEGAYVNLIYGIVTHYLGRISTQLKISPHVLRHSFATSLLNRGAAINDIKELLGHANLAATQIYTHSSVEKLKSIYKQAHPKA
jgi:integrase/recombinase XerC